MPDVKEEDPQWERLLALLKELDGCEVIVSDGGKPEQGTLSCIGRVESAAAGHEVGAMQYAVGTLGAQFDVEPSKCQGFDRLRPPGVSIWLEGDGKLVVQST